MREPREIGEDDEAWKIEEGNVCCLTANEYSNFSEYERRVLRVITSAAQAADFQR